jgi:hypothetical protein
MFYLRRSHDIDSDAIFPDGSSKTFHKHSDRCLGCGILQSFWPVDESCHAALQDETAILDAVSLLETSEVVQSKLCGVQKTLEIHVNGSKSRLLRSFIWIYT